MVGLRGQFRSGKQGDTQGISMAVVRDEMFAQRWDAGGGGERWSRAERARGE
jgi:hypothetical protein